jgi:signal transduction histidine kinase
LSSSLNSYLGGLTAKVTGVEARDGASIEDLKRTVISDALTAWGAAHAELDRLLQQRIGNLTRGMLLSLALIAAAAGISIFIAVLTHHYIVRPLERLEAVALHVREAKDYSLRAKYRSSDEIGRVTVAFNDMLAELATARNREMAQRAELARATRLTTMGEMAASIAHEVNQPLSAIVTNGNAGLRWLARATPDLDRVQAILGRIVRDGQRAGDVVASVRAMFKRDTQNRAALRLDAVMEEVLRLVRDEMQGARVSLEVSLGDDIPPVRADRVQIEQVLVNLITNAIDAMSSLPPERPRQLKVKVGASKPDDVQVAVEDSGPGITPQDMERVFEPFFTTKAGGMGLGLSICRSIVEAHGGRLWVSAGDPDGTAFMFTLPVHEPDRA